jgi:hypothetical protein
MEAANVVMLGRRTTSAGVRPAGSQDSRVAIVQGFADDRLT